MTPAPAPGRRDSQPVPLHRARLGQRLLLELAWTCGPTTHAAFLCTWAIDQRIGAQQSRPMDISVVRGDGTASHSKLNRWGLVLATLFAFAGLAALWKVLPFGHWLHSPSFQHELISLRHSPLAAALAVATFVVAGIVAFPLTVLTVQTGLLFGGWLGFLYSAAGALSSAAATYWVGRKLGHRRMQRASGKRLCRLEHLLQKRGILAIAAVRSIPVAPFGILNAFAGSSGVRFRDFFWGSLLGMLPEIAILTFLGHQLADGVHHPSPWYLALGVLLAGLWLLASRLLNPTRNTAATD